MKRYILSLVGAMLAIASFAHQRDVSSTLLVEKENNVWILQINASLTAFQQEVKTHFAERPYKSPEEFQEMVLQHIKKNFQLHFNEDQQVTLRNGMVQLGHETKVVFEVLGVPTELHSAEVTNTAFKDIYKNQSTLILFKENFAKNKFILNGANNHTASLIIDENKFIEKDNNKTSLFSSNLVLVLIGLLGLGLMILQFFREKRNRFAS